MQLSLSLSFGNIERKRSYRPGRRREQKKKAKKKNIFKTLYIRASDKCNAVDRLTRRVISAVALARARFTRESLREVIAYMNALSSSSSFLFLYSYTCYVCVVVVVSPS